MFGRKNYAKEYARLNPRCSSIFHEMTDTISARITKKLSREFLNDDSIRNQLSKDFDGVLGAISRHDHEHVSANIASQVVSGIIQIKPSFEFPADVASAIVNSGFIRRIVFGYAPGFAVARGSDPYQETLSLCWTIAGMFRLLDQDEFTNSSHFIWSSFHDACVEVHGSY